MTSMKNTAISLVQIKFRSFRWQRKLVRLNSAREFDIRLTRGLSRSDFKSGEKIKPMGCKDGVSHLLFNRCLLAFSPWPTVFVSISASLLMCDLVSTSHLISSGTDENLWETPAGTIDRGWHRANIGALFSLPRRLFTYVETEFNSMIPYLFSFPSYDNRISWGPQ